MRMVSWGNFFDKDFSVILLFKEFINIISISLIYKKQKIKDR